MDIHYKPIEPDEFNRHTLALVNSYNVILVNHMFHANTDDYGGYPGSDVCQENEMALFVLDAIIKKNRAPHFELPKWYYMALGAAATYCALHLLRVMP